MDREIIFRGKRKDNGEWIYGYFIETPSTTPCIVTIENYRNAHHAVIKKSAGQYTGLLDKNGDKIYEGDIIEYPATPIDGYDQETGEPIFGEEIRMRDIVLFKIGYFQGSYLNTPCLWSAEINKIEIIGNQFDNPELLKTEVETEDEMQIL